MHAKDFAIDESRDVEEIKNFYTIFPRICIPIFSNTLLIKAINLKKLYIHRYDATPFLGRN